MNPKTTQHRKQNKTGRFLIFLVILLTGVGATGILIERPNSFQQLLGSIFTVTLTTQDLHQHYETNQIKILVVPGHDPDYWGTEFKGIREADLTLAMARELTELLNQDQRFRVSATRDFTSGEYTDQFKSYFTDQRTGIQSFRNGLRAEFRALLNGGLIRPSVVVDHARAPDEVSQRLYGINKWANENNVDIALHIHFNDFPGRIGNRPGPYHGFTIYTPENQYPNAETSNDLAKAILTQMKEHVPVSNFPKESQGIVQDQQLVATGANASRKGASVLIEYGYIYENQFMSPDVRKKILHELAFQTVQGIENYFNDKNGKRSFDNTSLLPYKWKPGIQKGQQGKPEILALQAALRKEKLYPPASENLSSCPVNGNFGPCTEQALKQFQQKYKDDILQATGTLTKETIRKLNELYGPKP